jgi:DNA invertase Pin-like site-specific DNA recombinase
LISQRTKEALALKKSEGIILGRPHGSKSSCVKLTGKENEIKELRKKKLGKSAIGRILNVHRMTLDRFMQEKNIQ